jgi:hypothetical protein
MKKQDATIRSALDKRHILGENVHGGKMKFFNTSRAVSTIIAAVLILTPLALATGVAEGDAAPDISFQTLKGNTLSLYAHTCAKPALIWFTNFGRASVEAFPEIARLHEQYAGKGLRLIIISLKGEDAETPSSFAERFSLGGAIFLDPRGRACYLMAGEYLEGTLPSNNLFLLDGHKRARLVRHFPGIPVSTLEKEIRQMLE